MAQLESLFSSLSFSLLVDIIKLFFFQEETYHSSTFVHQETGVGLCFPRTAEEPSAGDANTAPLQMPGPQHHAALLARGLLVIMNNGG